MGHNKEIGEIMITYDTLLTTAVNELQGFKKRYEYEIERDTLDEETGMHTIFSFVFVPIISDAIKKDEDLARQYFGYMEKMELSEDALVQEVCEFTILEELCDEFNGVELEGYMGEATKDAYNLIRRYIGN